MDIQKEREAFQIFCEQNFDFERHEQTYFDEQTQCYENDIGEDTESINMAWMAWQAAKAHQAEKLKGCVVVPTTPSYEMWSGIARDLGRYMQMHDRYCPKTLKKYFDRFIGDIPEWLNKEVKDWNSDHAFATADLPAFIYMSMLEAARSQS